MKKLFNNHWEFAKTDITTTIQELSTLPFQAVDLPHDWLIYNTNDLYETSYGWYRKQFSLDKFNKKQYRLYFEGVYMDCDIYMNGKKIFEWKYGYASFEVDVTEDVVSGENEIVVLVRHRSPNSRWYSGAGIYRNVWLIETGESYIQSDSVYFSTKKEGLDWNCEYTVECANIGSRHSIRMSIEDEKKTLIYQTLERLQGEVHTMSFSLKDARVKVWDIASPNLMYLRTELLYDGHVVDDNVQRVGFREITFDSSRGFFLNGNQIKLQGVCLHHDLGALGAAVNKEAIKRQLVLMKEMGANAIRTSHNMPAVEVMDLCDELGLLVDSEAYDTWERPKTEFDHARFFLDWYQKDVASWIRRDRNHPSVIMWSIGNEIYDTHVSKRGVEITKMLRDEVKKHDYRSNAFVTIGSNYMGWENAQACAEEVELAGYNYGERLYEEHHRKYPEWNIYGSETTSGVKSRGVYHFPANTTFLTHDDLQCSSLGNCRGGFNCETAAEVILTNQQVEFCAGMFIWTGIDYIGEPSPYFTKNAYFGQCDTAGLKKDSYWLYKAAWTKEPVLHLFPYWDYNVGQLVDVIVYSNLKEVELLVNGVSKGSVTVDNYQASWCVPYEVGEIVAIGYDEEGNVYKESKHSFKDSKQIVLSAEKTTVKADGKDLVAVTISTVDEDGYPVENARDRIHLSVSGGRLLGFDNGDSTDYDAYKGTSRRLFSGKAVAFIAAKTEVSEIILEAHAPGLEPASLRLDTVYAKVEEGISASESLTTLVENSEVSIRKIELLLQGDKKLGKEQKECVIEARIYPEQATYQDLEWSVVTNTGIPTGLASIEVEQNKAKLIANGDGEFRLRCTAKNGRPQPEVISEYEFRVEGMGQMTLSPYEFVPACLNNQCIKEFSETANGGVGIQEENRYIGFANVDFGKYGSNQFEVRMIHWFSDEPICFRLYRGMPWKGESSLLGEYTYQANFIWQTYQSNTFKLEDTLYGVQDICFEIEKKKDRLDFGGFSFVPILKAYEEIKAIDNDTIRGDSFELQEDRIDHIGNNVFLEFDEMNFVEGVSKILITGRTHHDNDSIHLYITTEDGQELQEIIEFPHSDEDITIQKDLPNIVGNGTVKFVFLPGCDFDFVSFRIH